jgi:predicted GNAT family N-acyltransferase
MIEVVEAQDERDRQAAYALRFAIYVDEMGRRQANADPLRREVREPEDQSAHLLIARTSRGEVVGTARVHLKRDIPASLASLYRLEQFAPFHPTESSTTTKLMIDRRYRGTPLAVQIARACYDIGDAAGVSLNFIDCNAHLRPFFMKLGFRQVFADFIHADYGLVSPLVLALRDTEHLRRMGSPLLRHDRQDGHPSVAFLARLEQDHLQPATRP